VGGRPHIARGYGDKDCSQEKLTRKL
jgi:hypothetical protein